MSGSSGRMQFPTYVAEFIDRLSQNVNYDPEKVITVSGNNTAPDITDMEQRLSTLETTVAGLQTSLDTVSDDLDAAVSRLDTAQDDIVQLASDISDLVTLTGNHTTQISDMLTSITNLQTSLNTITNRIGATWDSVYPGLSVTTKMQAVDTLNTTQNSRLDALESTSSSALLAGWTATYPGTSVTQKMTLVDGVNGVQTTRLDNYDNGTTATSQIRLANNSPFGARIHCDGSTNVSMYFDSTTRTGQLYKNGNDMVMRCNTGRMQLLSDTSSISLYGQKQPTGGVGVLNTHGVYVTGRDDDATQNVQSLLSVVGNAASTTQLNVASGHLASALGSGTYCSVNGVSTTGVSFAGGSNIYDATLNPTGTDHAIRCYSSANKTALGKTASFEMSDFMGYSVYKTAPEFDAAKTATDPLISMTYLDYRLNVAYQYVFVEGRSNGCTPATQGQGINSRFLGSNFNYQQVQSHPYGTQGSLVFFDNTNGQIAMYAGKTYKITIMAYPQTAGNFYMRLRLYNLQTQQPLLGTNGAASDLFAVNVSTNVNEPSINAFVTMYTPVSSHAMILSLEQLSGLAASNINYIRWFVEIYNNSYP